MNSQDQTMTDIYLFYAKVRTLKEYDEIYIWNKRHTHINQIFSCDIITNFFMECKYFANILYHKTMSFYHIFFLPLIFSLFQDQWNINKIK